jgi:hypothetical protein
MKDTIDYEANEFNKEFVELLKEKSEIFLFLLQINSGSGFNLLTGKNTAKLSMLNESDVKTHLNSIIQNYGIKMNYVGCFNAYTVNEVRITCINESSALHLSLDKKITLKDDPVYNKRYILANLLQREEFGHSFYNHRVEKENKLDPTSPIEFYNAIIKEKFIEIAKKAGESGVALSMFLTRGDINLMILLKSDSINFTELFHKPSLLTEEDLSEFINKLRSIHPNVFNFDENDEDDYYKMVEIFIEKTFEIIFLCQISDPQIVVDLNQIGNEVKYNSIVQDSMDGFIKQKQSVIVIIPMFYKGAEKGKDTGITKSQVLEKNYYFPESN